MVSFRNRIYDIIDMDKCMPEYGIWFMTCREKTMMYMIKSIVWLVSGIIRDNALQIIILSIVFFETYSLIMRVKDIKRLNHRQQTNRNDHQPPKESQHQPELTQYQHVEVNVISEQPFSHPDNTAPKNQLLQVILLRLSKMHVLTRSCKTVVLARKTILVNLA
jgi:hypothetical protein